MNVFVSYSNADALYARQLADALRQRGIEVLEDVSITAGASWATELRRMMEDADAFVLLTSKSSAGSPWVDREIAAAAAKSARDRDIRLIPVVLDRRSEIPPLLSRYQGIGYDSAKDPNRVADLIQKSLNTATHPPDLNLEHEIVDAERANLNLEIRQRHLEVISSWAGLARVVSVLGIATGLAATTMVAIWVNAGGGVATILLAVVSLVSAALSAAVAIYFRRSQDGH